MHGLGVPLATPFDDEESVDHDALAELTEWVTERGVDFLVPCGSNSEAELMTLEERARAVETVCNAVPGGVDVLAGTGHPGLRETTEQTRRAAEAGADGALVVTPFYFQHGGDALEAYYRRLADDVDLPVYLYSVPAYTGTRLAPGVVDRLADHENVRGMKDSSGDLEAFQRTRAVTRDADFDFLVGSGSIYAPALDAGADGGVLALANVVPERCDEIYELHRTGDDEAARRLNRDLVELNRAITTEYGVAGVKAAMRYRDAPAGRVRLPHQPLPESARANVEALVDAALP